MVKMTKEKRVGQKEKECEKLQGPSLWEVKRSEFKSRIIETEAIWTSEIHCFLDLWNIQL